MSAVQWVLCAWIGVSALVVLGRGCAGNVRTYTVAEGILGLAECGVMIWLVTTL